MYQDDSTSAQCNWHQPAARTRGNHTRAWKNAVLNLFKAILKAIKCDFGKIIFVPEKNQLNVVSIMILCLLARNKLSQLKLKKFQDMIVKIVDKKVNFQQRKLERLQNNLRTTQREMNVHRKSIHILNRLKTIAVSLIQYSGAIEVKYLKELLTLVFSQFSAHQIGQHGRQAIQQNKIQTSLIQIQKALRVEIQQQGNLMEEESDSDDQSNSARTNSRNQIGVQANESDLISEKINENSNEWQEVVQTKEREKIWQGLQGDGLIDILTRPSFDQCVEEFTDFFIWKQEEEIKTQVVLKCNDIECQLLRWQ